MDKIRTNIFEENERLREQLDYKTKQANDWQNKYYELLNELKKTQALLRQFLNENTPSSKLPFKYPSKEQSEKEQKPRGKPEGSNGWRKMLGGHKTREGTKQYAIIQTHRETWKHQGKYPYNELLNVLKN